MFFFFKHKTAYERRISDWSSDACSSDLLARLIALQEQELARTLIGIDLRGQGGGVRKLQRHMAFPAGLERGDIDDDAAARIGRFAEADDEYVPRDAEIFDRAGEREAVRRDDAHVRSEEHTSELQSLMRISYAVFCLKKKKNVHSIITT